MPLTVQVDRNVDGADVGDGLDVGDACALQVRGCRCFPHIDPADGLLGIDEVHGHRLLGGDGGQSGRGAA